MAGAVGGSVNTGKSTLVAVLTHGVGGMPVLDGGCGKARTSVFRHKHEVQTGHTSSISQAMLGYNAEGDVLNYLGVSRLTAVEIGAAAGKMLHFIDLGGNTRYVKTALYGVLPRICFRLFHSTVAELPSAAHIMRTLNASVQSCLRCCWSACVGMVTFKVLYVRAGMTSLLPDFLMLCVCAKTGLDLTTREHFAAALALDIPVFCVVTKTDIVSAIELERTLGALRMLLTTAADAGTIASVPLRVTGASADELSECEE